MSVFVRSKGIVFCYLKLSNVGVRTEERYSGSLGGEKRNEPNSNGPKRVEELYILTNTKQKKDNSVITLSL